MTASKCWPSPLTARCVHGRPAAIVHSMDSGVTMLFEDDEAKVAAAPSSAQPPSELASVPQPIAALEQEQREGRQPQRRAADDGQADPGRDVGQTEKPVAEAVDHIEERIEVRNFLPEAWQRM